MDKILALAAFAHTMSIKMDPHMSGRDSVTNYVNYLCFNENVIGDLRDGETLYILQVYPTTPVGFNIWAGHNLDALLDAALDHYGLTLTEAVMDPKLKATRKDVINACSVTT